MFTVAGVSRNKGKVKVRFCSDKVLRVKNLQKQGDTDINLIDLPKSMSKAECCDYLLSLPEFSQYKVDIEEVSGRYPTGSKPAIKLPKAEVETVDADIEKIKELITA